MSSRVFIVGSVEHIYIYIYMYIFICIYIEFLKNI